MIKLKNNPVKKIRITSKFGPRNYQGYAFHSGTDFGPDKSSNEPEYIYAVNDGIVKVAKVDSSGLRGGYGKYVVIEHDGFCTLNSHLDSYNVSVGQKVKAGDIIGIMGNTGDSTGKHLHFEIRACKYDSNFWRKGSLPGEILMAVNPEKYLLEEKTLDTVITDKQHWGEDYLDKLVKRGIISNPEVWTDFDNPPSKAMLLALVEKLLLAIEDK